MSTPIQQFNDFMRSTGPSFLTSAEDVVNEAVKRTYALSRFLKERTSEELIQGGTQIRDDIMFDDAGTYDHYLPNQSFTWKNPQVLQQIALDWRFSLDHMSWTDQEIELNVPSGMSRDGLKIAYKRLKKIKEQRMWTSMLNGMEDDLWRTPFGNYGEMEGASGKLQYSLPSFITERQITTLDGFRGGAPLGWTLLETIDPTTEWRWSNAIQLYDPNLAANAAAVAPTLTGFNAGVQDISGLLPAFDAMWLKLQFVPPPTHKEYFENPVLNRQVIFASRLGRTRYQRALRDANDRLVSPQDAAYNDPTYSGVQVAYAAAMDQAPLFPRAAGSIADTFAGRNGATVITTAGGTETQAETIDKGPRFYFVNGNYIVPIFHARRYMKTHDVKAHPNQPFTHVQPTDCWWNLFCRSRQRQGIVAPARSV